MRKHLLPFGLLFAIGSSLVGCGGSGGGTTTTSAFVGQYSGTWEQLSEFNGPTPLGAGTITFLITDKGVVSGSFTETLPLQRTGNATGTVKADGTITFSVAYPGGAVPYSGEIEKANGSIDGSFSEVGSGSGGFFPFMHLEPSDL